MHRLRLACSDCQQQGCNGMTRHGGSQPGRQARRQHPPFHSNDRLHYCAVTVLEQLASKDVREKITFGTHLTTLSFSEAESRSHFWASASMQPKMAMS